MLRVCVNSTFQLCIPNKQISPPKLTDRDDANRSSMFLFVRKMDDNF